MHDTISFYRTSSGRSARFLRWDYTFSTYAKFSEKLTSYTLMGIRSYVYQGVKNVSFSEVFAHTLNA